eukprot:2318822-Alexandrium_andersonii.AAC.1
MASPAASCKSWSLCSRSMAATSSTDTSIALAPRRARQGGARRGCRCAPGVLRIWQQPHRLSCRGCGSGLWGVGVQSDDSEE